MNLAGPPDDEKRFVGLRQAAPQAKTIIYSFGDNIVQVELTDDVERVAEDGAGGPPPGEVHGRRGRPLLRLAVVPGSQVKG